MFHAVCHTATVRDRARQRPRHALLTRTLLCHVYHALSGMLGAEPRFVNFVLAKRRELLASLVTAPLLASNGDHPLASVLCAVLNLSALSITIRRTFGASPVTALFVLDVDHPPRGVFEAKVSLFAACKAERSCCVAPIVFAGIYYAFDHLPRGVLGAELSLLAVCKAEQGLGVAPIIFAEPL